MKQLSRAGTNETVAQLFLSRFQGFRSVSGIPESGTNGVTTIVQLSRHFVRKNRDSPGRGMRGKPPSLRMLPQLRRGRERNGAGVRGSGYLQSYDELNRSWADAE